jgi:addiction module RelE/StbE family toxin
MAQTVIWSNESLDDIDSIAEFIARDSLYHAQRVIEIIFERVEQLAEQPESGRRVPELNNPHVREIFVYSYRLIYEVKKEEIAVLGVIHGKSLLENTERFN